MILRLCAWSHRFPRLLGLAVDWRPRVLLSHGICRAHSAVLRAYLRKEQA